MRHHPTPLTAILAGLAVALLSLPASAAEPPPCVPTGLAQADVLKRVLTWSGYRPVRKWRRLAVRLDPCKATGDTARLLLTVAPPGRARSGVQYEGELILSLQIAGKKPLDNAAHRAQVSRLARDLPAAAKAAEANRLVSAWLKAQRRQGRRLAARLNDMGGHSPACLVYGASSEDTAETVLRWCTEGGLERYTLVAPHTLDRSELKTLAAFIATTRPGCHLDRLQMRPSGKGWQASARLAGKPDCDKRFRAVANAAGEWKQPRIGGRGRRR